MANRPFHPPAPGASGRAEVVVPSDATVFTNATRGVWVGGAGNLAVRPIGQDTAVTFTAVTAGTLIPIAVDKVMATGTTATNLVAMY